MIEFCMNTKELVEVFATFTLGTQIDISVNSEISIMIAWYVASKLGKLCKKLCKKWKKGKNKKKKK